ARLDHQGARQDHRRQFRIAELLQQAEDVAIDRLLPEMGPVTEVAADADGIDPPVEGASVEGKEAAFAPADDADLRRGLARILAEPIDCGQYLLYLVADQVATEFERGAVQEFPAGQLGPTVALLDLPVDQDGHEHATTAFGQTAGVLRLGGNSFD